MLGILIESNLTLLITPVTLPKGLSIPQVASCAPAPSLDVLSSKLYSKLTLLLPLSKSLGLGVAGASTNEQPTVTKFVRREVKKAEVV